MDNKIKNILEQYILALPPRIFFLPSICKIKFIQIFEKEDEIEIEMHFETPEIPIGALQKRLELFFSDFKNNARIVQEIQFPKLWDIEISKQQSENKIIVKAKGKL